MAPDAIVHNSPALDSLKHQQLRSLCARHRLKSTGKRDALIKRLKALRTTSGPDAVDEDEPAGMTEDSFDFLDEDPEDEEELEEARSDQAAQQEGRPSTSTARIATDEFGALSIDAGILTKSSSIKSLVSKLFGGSSSSNSTITASSSSGSISSLANTTMTKNSSSGPSILSSNNTTVDTQERQTKSSSGSMLDPVGPILSPRPTTKPAYRILDDSFANNTTVYNPDASFVPRSSFDDDSVALANVPIWPPPPGLVLISPRQSPPKLKSAVPDVISPPSAILKRRYEDFSEDEAETGDDKLDDYFHTIRMLPKSPQMNGMLSPPSRNGAAPATPSTSARKIAKVPKRYSMLAASPPRFDLEAPALPSLAGVMASMQQSNHTESDINLPGSFKTSTIAAEPEISEAKVVSPPQAALSPPTAAFTFGSPVQKAHVFSPPPASSKDSVLAKQLEEMQRRMGSTSGVLKVTDNGDLLPASIGNGGSLFVDFIGKKTGNGVRFEDTHVKEFNKMDSIASHYAAKRSSTFMPAKRTKTDESSGSASASDNVAMSRKASSASLVTLNQQGRAAPMIPDRPAPGPKAVKTSAQQAEDRKRIFDLAAAGNSGTTSTADRDAERARQIRRKSRGAVPGSARKAARVADPGQRRLPPSPSKVPLPPNTANPVIPIKPRTISSSTSGFFKNSFNSLKSFASSGSISSKATGSTGAFASGSVASKASTITQSASHGSLAQRPAPSYTSSSLHRPTAASLARAVTTSASGIRHVPSSSNIPVPSSPLKPDIPTVLQNLPSPPTNNPFDASSRHKSPMLKGVTSLSSTSPPKKRVSSISSAQRSPHKSGTKELSDSISEARKIRAKRDRQRSANGVLNTVDESGNARAANGTGYLAGKATGSLAGRPAWR